MLVFRMSPCVYLVSLTSTRELVPGDVLNEGTEEGKSSLIEGAEARSSYVGCTPECGIRPSRDSTVSRHKSQMEVLVTGGRSYGGKSSKPKTRTSCHPRCITVPNGLSVQVQTHSDDWDRHTEVTGMRANFLVVFFRNPDDKPVRMSCLLITFCLISCLVFSYT